MPYTKLQNTALKNRKLVVDQFVAKGESLYKIWKIQLILSLTLYLVPIIVSAYKRKLVFTLLEWTQQGFWVFLACLTSVLVIFTASLVNAYRTWKVLTGAKEAIWYSMKHPKINREIKNVRWLLIVVVICAAGMFGLFRVFKYTKEVEWGLYVMIGVVSAAHIISTSAKCKFCKKIAKIKKLNLEV